MILGKEASMPMIPRALTIAGSDCSGGAGIQADLKTFHAFGVYGASAVTAVVAENTAGVLGISPVAPEFVALQIESVLSDVGADAVKTGMLVDAPVIRAVAGALRARRIGNLVVDPVMRAKGGDPLIDPEAVETLVKEIFPLALVVTPNVPEAEALAGHPLRSEEDLRAAAEAIRAMGPKIVLMKGGHDPSGPRAESVDFAWDGVEWRALRGERSSDRNTHGTGCTLSAAITALLARGEPPLRALELAKAYVTEAIRTAPGLGHGHGPVNHWAKTSA
jgi:hydroxymethylpyrimidine/phosphomethylpyrimidine kinase